MTIDLRKYGAQGEAPAPNGEAPAPNGGGEARPAGRPPVPENWMTEITLEDARRIYVRDHYHRFEKAFAKCDAAGSLQVSAAVAPFFFGWLWFIYRKMYLEAAVIFVAGCVLSLAVEGASSSDWSYSLVSLGVALILALASKGLYWKAVDRQIAKAMALFPNHPREALNWLAARGGVNIWAPLAIVALGLLFFMVLGMYMSEASF